jgi:microcystin-dependent protein
MSEPYLGQLLLVSFNFPPKGWAMCNGQLLPINQNQALFSLLGTTFGGDGRQTFALPNLQGRNPIMSGKGYVLGEVGGQETHTLILQESPQHTHTIQGATAAANQPKALAHLPGTTTGNFTPYLPSPGGLTPLGNGTITMAGGSQPHENRQPYLTMNWIIALQGIFPSQN